MSLFSKLEEKEKLEKALEKDKLIGFTRDKVWVPLKYPKKFFGSIIGMLIPVPVFLDAWNVFKFLGMPNPFHLGWTSPIELIAFGALWLVSFFLFVDSVTRQEHLPVVGLDDGSELTEERVKRLIEESKQPSPTILVNPTPAEMEALKMRYISDHIEKLVEEADEQKAGEILAPTAILTPLSEPETESLEGSPTKRRGRRGRHSD